MWTREQRTQRLNELEAELERGTAQLNRIAGAILILKEELSAPTPSPIVGEAPPSKD